MDQKNNFQIKPEFKEFLKPTEKKELNKSNG